MASLTHKGLARPDRGLITLMANISFYGSHNAAIVVERDGEILIVLEIERFNAYKNSGVAQFKVPANPFQLMEKIVDFIKRRFDIETFENCIALNVDSIWGDKKVWFDEFIPAHNYIRSGYHHESHAANAFYQSPYDEAIAFSFDGGGNDGFFNIYECSRDKGPKVIANIHRDFGVPYMVFGQYLKDIKLEHSLGDGNLIYPGKIMGLVSFGNVREEWLEHFKFFYLSNVTGINYEEHTKILGDKIGIDFQIHNRLEGQDAWDVAATSQKAFEECFLDIARPYFETYPNLPVLVCGGCALNILLNTRIKQEFGKDVFVGPSPNDCGIATGLMLNFLKPKTPPVLTYSGLPILDIDTLPRYFIHHHEQYNLESFVDYIQSGKIIGIVRGNSEHGPRALGNRSIICDPTFPDMKEILNSKVKHREWYRPFAPLVRLEDVNKYFEFEGESEHMTFAPLVREEWREVIPAVTHVDNTARVQTITRKQNEFIYDILTEMDRRNGIGVLLNTSFNVDGQPILTTIDDAFKVYWNSQMDFLLINDVLLKKQP
jgi:carbamoyltransferase